MILLHAASSGLHQCESWSGEKHSCFHTISASCQSTSCTWCTPMLPLESSALLQAATFLKETTVRLPVPRAWPEEMQQFRLWALSRHCSCSKHWIVSNQRGRRAADLSLPEHHAAKRFQSWQKDPGQSQSDTSSVCPSWHGPQVEVQKCHLEQHFKATG